MTTTDWAGALAATSTTMTPEQIKAQLPIAYVLDVFDIPLEKDGSKYAALCPFHLDSHPSLDVYGENLERWGCFTCGAGGDVFDLIGRLDGGTFSDQLVRAQELLADVASSGWTGPRLGIKRPFDSAAARSAVAASEVNELGAVYDFLAAKAADNPGLARLDARWLHERFGVGSRGDEIIVPYWARDGQLVTYKHRTARTNAMSASGSDFSAVLYGEWLDTDTTLPVLLCEGESDVWAAAAVLPHYAVLGLPTGAGAHARQAERLAGRDVTLAFDGDAAGRAALVRWHAALGPATRVVAMPDGADLAGCTDLMALVAKARKVPPVPPGIIITPDGYAKPGKETNTPLSNWAFAPDRELLGDGGSAYEGAVTPTGRAAVLSSFHLSGKARIVAWSSAQGAAWYGADRDAQLLLGVLQAEGPFLRPGRMTTVAGLHDGHFVWPGGSIGTDHWVYVDPPSSIGLDQQIHCEPGTWNPAQVLLLRELHAHRVTDPILAWLALAPLRSLRREFPVLAVTGSSGSGKTTLIEAMLGAFSGGVVTSNLTSTTRYAIFAFAGATNGFPVWFDEYRPGARRDALQTLDQVLRDAYTSQSSAKGGMGERWSEVTSVPVSSPIIVSGEDAFSETSHTERMVLVSLPAQGRNAAALGGVKAWGPTGLAHAYLSWISDRLEAGTLPYITASPAGPDDLPDRQRLNLGALVLGWSLLELFLQDHGVELPEPDWSLVIAEGREASTHNPIKDAVLWALEEDDGANSVSETDGWVYLRPENFVRFVNDRGTHVLPGGPTAIRKYVETNYAAMSTKTSRFGGQKRALVFRRDQLGAEA